MKALIDKDLHRSLKDVLVKFGFEVVDLRDTKLRGKSDEVIFRFAQRNKMIIFTGDLDFSSILKYPPKSHYGIVILRFPNEFSTKKINEMVEELLSKIEINQLKNSITILSPGKIRIRK